MQIHKRTKFAKLELQDILQEVWKTISVYFRYAHTPLLQFLNFNNFPFE